MTLHKGYVRDGKSRIIGSVTSGFDDTSEVVRDADGLLINRTK